MTVVLQSGNARVEVLPERGGLVTQYLIGDAEVLYMDPATLEDPTRSVRGGIPLLFPIAGKLEDDQYQVGELTFELKQHGFARKLPWAVVEQRADFLSMELTHSGETLRHFPWRFSCLLSLALEPEKLTLTWTTRNLDTEAMPLHLGFHPYFYVPQTVKSEVQIDTGATRAFDNRSKETESFEGFDLSQDELDLHLLDHDAPGTVLSRGPHLAPIRLKWSPEFKTMVVWTLGGRDFVCVEPWTAPGGALGKPEHLINLPAGEEKTLTFEISV